MSSAVIQALEQLSAITPRGGSTAEDIRQRTRVICVGVFGEPQLTQAQVGERLGLSRSMIRLIENKALRHLGEGLIERMKKNIT